MDHPKAPLLPTDSLDLDAKQMFIEHVALVEGKEQQALKYTYDGWHLRIQLNKTYKATEKYTLYISYTAKPDEAKVPDGSKGLHFINPKGDNNSLPTEIWTDDETNHSSVWCPIIDQPNQKTTEEIIMTVPQKYVTLSNGRLVSELNNADGTRTDDWKDGIAACAISFFHGGRRLCHCKGSI